MGKKNEKVLDNKLSYIDLFSGAGGLSLGFEKAGFKNIFSLDSEQNFCKTYKRNFPEHKLIEKDITSLTKKEILDHVGNVKINVIVGGPPCQGFSIAGGIGRKFIDDPRNHLFKEFLRFVEIIKPDFFVMENVARLFTHNKGGTREEIISKFKKIGYKVECRILNSADYGVPQMRRRVIFIGSNKTSKFLFPERTVKKYLTVREALKNLPTLKSGEISSTPNHVAMKHSNQMLEKMSYVLNGGNRDQIPDHIRPKSGDVRKYIRYNKDKPSITITGDMRKVFHFSQNRALTVRELARLQSFPDSFLFEGPSISQQQQVGNSVPPLMAETLAEVVKKMIYAK